MTSHLRDTCNKISKLWSTPSSIRDPKFSSTNELIFDTQKKKKKKNIKEVIELRAMPSHFDKQAKKISNSSWGAR